MADPGYSFAGKKVIVTGAGRGIGRDLALKLANCGATVVAISRTAETLTSLASEHPSIIPVVCDITNISEMRAALEPHLPVHMLVNNAGTNVPQSFLEITEEAYETIMSINLKAVIFLTQTVVKSMVEKAIPGSIVLISSQAATTPILAHTVYTASKCALDSLVKSVSLEFGKSGIRINSVQPTVVMTELGKRDWPPEKAEPLLARMPLGKFAEIQDVVEAVLFLLSDRASMMTAVCLPVDGGYSAM